MSRVYLVWTQAEFEGEKLIAIYSTLNSAYAFVREEFNDYDFLEYLGETDLDFSWRYNGFLDIWITEATVEE